jgi:hypothetical protein
MVVKVSETPSGMTLYKLMSTWPHISIKMKKAYHMLAVMRRWRRETELVKAKMASA